MAPFYEWGSTASRLRTATSRRQFTFYHSVPRNSWYSFYRPRKDERLSRPWSHPVVLNMGPLDWENSALTTRPLLHTRHFPILSFSKWVAMCVLLVYTIPSVRMKRIAIAICDLFFHYCDIKEISFCCSCDTKPCAKHEKIHVNYYWDHVSKVNEWCLVDWFIMLRDYCIAKCKTFSACGGLLMALLAIFFRNSKYLR